MTGYSYAIVETALARVFRIKPADQKAFFRGRLQHLRRLGLPGKGRGRGGGPPRAYSDNETCELLIALELEEFGIDPALAVRMVTGQTGPDQRAEGSDWQHYLPKVIQEARKGSGGDADIILMVEPYFMSAPGRGDPRFDPATFRHVKADSAGIKEFEHLLRGWGAGTPDRVCAFNLSERLRSLDAALKAVQEEDKAP
jgi:hypothetical protein